RLLAAATSGHEIRGWSKPARPSRSGHQERSRTPVRLRARSLVHLPQKVLEIFDAARPDGTVAGEPGMERRKSLRVDSIMSVTPFAPLAHQPCLPQYRQMLAHRRLGDGEALTQIGGCRLALRQALQNGAARRIGQGLEYLSLAHALH